MIRRWVPPWAVLGVILISAGTIWLRLSIFRTTYAIGQADQRIRTLTHDREQAELRLASLKSPRRLEKLARTQFNLTQPRADQVVYFK